MIYKAREIGINCTKCGKNTDLLTIEILTITSHQHLKLSLMNCDLIMAIMDNFEGMFLKIIV